LIVAKGFYYQEGINYTKTFSLIPKMNFFIVILSLVTHFGWEVHNMGVKGDSLHVDLTDEIYVEEHIRI
jgi:hypothetical protein